MHVKNAEAFDSVVDEVVKASKGQLAVTETQWDKLVVVMKAIESVAGSKKGGRVSGAFQRMCSSSSARFADPFSPPQTATSRPKLFALLSPISKLVLLPSTPPPPFLHSYTTMTVGLLLLATFQDVLSGGAKDSIEVLFANPGSTPDTFSAGCTLVTSLDEVQWNHFSTSLTPLVLRETARYVASEVKEKKKEMKFGEVSPVTNSLSLLARLAWSGRLRTIVDGGTTAVKTWERTIGARCEASIKSWTDTYKSGTPSEDEVSSNERHGAKVQLIDSFPPASQTHELLDVLLIAPQLPYFHRTLLSLVADLAATVAATPSSTSRAAFLESSASPAQALGAALLAFSRITAVSKSPDPAVLLSLAQTVVPMIQGFAWHRGVMQGIAALELAKVASDQSEDNQKKVYDSILPNLMSEDSSLRLASLQIGATLFPPEITPVAADLIVKCIEVEEMPLTVQGAREKSMKVRKIGIVANGQLGRDGEEVKPALDIILRYLTGMSPLLTVPSSFD